MRILLLNWKDPKNPFAGGAEKLNTQILKALINNGHEVIWYAKAFNGSVRQEIYENIHIFRFGNLFTHFLYLPFLLWIKYFGEVNLIIDCVHGVGYLTPLICPKTQKIILVCEVAQNIWDEILRFPLNILGKIFELITFLIYKQENVWTISKSTKNDLIRFGVKKENIVIIPMGFDGPNFLPRRTKLKEKTALFVGRIAKNKGILDAIYVIARLNMISSEKWNLNIIGNGDREYKNKMINEIQRLKMQKYIRFLGFLSEKEKFKQMAKSWIMFALSSREGWGMVVAEANCSGTAVLGYHAPGIEEVLRYYSRNNISVNTIDEAVSILKGMNKPPVVNEKVEAGWDRLCLFIKRFCVKYDK